MSDTLDKKVERVFLLRAQATHIKANNSIPKLFNKKEIRLLEEAGYIYIFMKSCVLVK